MWRDGHNKERGHKYQAFFFFPASTVNLPRPERPVQLSLSPEMACKLTVTCW